MSRVQLKQGNGGGYVTSQTVTPDSPFTAGNTVKVIFGCGAADYPQITDSAGNTYIKVGEQIGSGSRRICIYEAYNVAAGSPTITLKTWQTVGFTGDQYTDRVWIIIEESGLTTTDPFDKTAGSNGSGLTSWPSGSTATLSQADEHVVGAICVDKSTGAPASLIYTADGGYGTMVTQAGFDQYTSLAYQDKEVSATTAVSITFGTSTAQGGGVAVVTFKKTGGGAPASTSKFFLMFN